MRRLPFLAGSIACRGCGCRPAAAARTCSSPRRSHPLERQRRRPAQSDGAIASAARRRTQLLCRQPRDCGSHAAALRPDRRRDGRGGDAADGTPGGRAPGRAASVLPAAPIRCATHVLKGYFSTMTEGKQTTVIYVWDVYDPQRQPPAPHQRPAEGAGSSGGEGWSAVPAADDAGRSPTTRSTSLRPGLPARPGDASRQLPRDIGFFGLIRAAACNSGPCR